MQRGEFGRESCTGSCARRRRRLDQRATFAAVYWPSVGAVGASRPSPMGTWSERKDSGGKGDNALRAPPVPVQVLTSFHCTNSVHATAATSLSPSACLVPVCSCCYLLHDQTPEPLFAPRSPTRLSSAYSLRRRLRLPPALVQRAYKYLHEHQVLAFWGPSSTLPPARDFLTGDRSPRCDTLSSGHSSGSRRRLSQTSVR